ncbi:MAG: efflux RND transporter permease subunit [Thiobacillus sp.]
MPLLRKLLENHPLANVTYLVVLVMGLIAYMQLPRAQYPEINLNWVMIVTALPGAAATDVEKLVTEPLEDAIRKVADIKYSSSTSRENVSFILVRFNEISAARFDKRINDLRREVQFAATTQLPRDARTPTVMEVTTSSGFPTAMVVLASKQADEHLYRNARSVQEKLESLPGVDKVWVSGMRNQELQVEFSPARMEQHGVTPDKLATSLRRSLRDVPAGAADLAGEQYLLRVMGVEVDPALVAKLPLLDVPGRTPPIRVEDVAQVQRGMQPASELVRHEGNPAVLLSVTRQPGANALDLLAAIKETIRKSGQANGASDTQVLLLDDQTQVTREAVHVMESNAVIGLLLVLLISWLFLSFRVALLVALGIPFAMAGTFWALSSLGHTLNVSVLLGVVIALGMLVDDAVVVVDSIHYRMVRGMESIQACLEGIREVFAPVLTSVLTTVAFFVPLMMMPGVVGKFMMVVPLVVTLALLVSLVEAFWMLPAHVTALNPKLNEVSRMNQLRVRLTHRLRVRYGRLLARVLRRPGWFVAALGGMFLLAAVAVATGWVKVQFFASDPMRIFNVNVQMQPGASLEDTMRIVREVENRVHSAAHPGEIRSTLAVAGQMFTETEQLSADNLGQLTVSLMPKTTTTRDVEAMIEGMRDQVLQTEGAKNIAFQVLSASVLLSKPVSIKVLGEDFTQLQLATDALAEIMKKIPGVKDISTDARFGKQEVTLKVDHEQAAKLGLDAFMLAGIIRLNFEGAVVTTLSDAQGEKLNVRVRAAADETADINAMLNQQIRLPQGGTMTLGSLFVVQTEPGMGAIRHYNFRRAISLQAGLDKTLLDTAQANVRIQQEWETIKGAHPGIELDFTGELDDIRESVNSLLGLFLLGVGLISLILGAQFRSYWKPLLVLTAVPIGFTGMTLGLWVTGHPISIYTLYGGVALAGISVNASIVMLSAANQRQQAGMSVLHAAIYAARRRVVPILITSTTTIGGLLSLAIGLAGESLLWGPLATAIIWGLVFSTVLTLFSMPALYIMLSNWLIPLCHRMGRCRSEPASNPA